MFLTQRPRFCCRCRRPLGPYRESFAEYCAELQSDALPLLIRCPNAVNDVGINREKWLPNPAVGKSGLSAAMHAEMLGFLGRLMGVAIRSQEPLDLDLPSIVWKQLVRSPITRLGREPRQQNVLVVKLGQRGSRLSRTCQRV